MSVQTEFDKLVIYLEKTHNGVAGQMFGKKCIKVNGKAKVALFGKSVVFKLPENIREQALSLAASELWDPSGKGRPMKEWVQVSVDHKGKFQQFAEASANYVG